jgi:hypothetical protein
LDEQIVGRNGGGKEEVLKPLRGNSPVYFALKLELKEEQDGCLGGFSLQSHGMGISWRSSEWGV